jgi:hypothetical protein
MTAADSLRVRQAALLAEQWKRSDDETVRRLAADLFGVLDFEDEMAAGFNRPMVVTKATLVGTLRDVLAVVEADDSAGGFVEYEWGNEPGQFEVRARYRVGNASGQGGVRMLHE